MKKFFAIIMSVLMIACFMPSMAFAANGDATSDANSKVSVTSADKTTKYYETLPAAISAAKDGDTITLLDNITIDSTYSATNRLNISVNNVTIDLNEKTLTVPNHTFTLTGKNITLKNGTMFATTTNSGQSYGSYAVAATGTGTKIDHVTMTGGVSATGYLPDEVMYNRDASVTITNCTISAGQFYAVCAQGDADATISNSTLKTIESANGKAGSTAFFWIENGNSSITYNASSVTMIGNKPLYNNSVATYSAPKVTVKDANGNDQAIEIVEVGTEETLKAAVKDGQNVMLKNDITLTGPITIGDSNTKDVTIAIVGNGHKLDGSTLEKSGDTEPRAISVYDGENMTVILKDLTIVGPTSGNGSRGISTGDDRNTTLILDNCNVSAKKYAINIFANELGTAPTIIVRNTEIDDETLQGYCAFQTTTPGTKATFENCILVGNNWWDNDGDNDFSTIVIYPAAKDSILTFKNCSIKANEIGTKADGKTPAEERLLSIRDGATGATVTFDNCKFFVNGNEVSDINKAISEMKWEDGAYIVKRTGSEGSYTYTVLPKSNLTGGVYLTNPEGALASSRYYVSSTENGVWTVSYAGGSSSSSTTTATDTVTNTTEDKKTDTSADTGSTTETTKVATTTATVKTETKTATDGTKTVAATVDNTTATKIVEKAVENKSEEVVIDTATTSSTGTTAVTETAAGTTTKVDLPEQTVKAIAEKTEAAVTIKSDAAEIKLDTEAVKAVAEQAGDAGTVNLVVETVAQNETKVEVDLKLVTSKGTVSDFKGGSVSVTVKLNTKLAAKPVVCVYIDDNGTYHKVKGVKNADGTYTFETGHFSTYAVMAEEEADKVIAEQTANVDKLISALTLKARSAKTAKGNIKVTLTADEDSIKAIEDLGYTVKYKFYRSTKKGASYKAKLEGTGKTYTNTTGKKGTKYYYKARVMVYDAQGELIAKTTLNQCKYAARTK